jgi:hypothetical protein
MALVCAIIFGVLGAFLTRDAAPSASSATLTTFGSVCLAAILGAVLGGVADIKAAIDRLGERRRADPSSSTRPAQA